MLTPWQESYDQPRQHIKKQRHYFAKKGPSGQGYGFSSSHVWMGELDYKESWVPNWCFWTVVLENTLESPLDSKEVKAVNPKGNQSWTFIGGTDAEVEAPILWPLMWRPDSLEKTLMLGKIEGRRRGWQRTRWLDGITNSKDMSLSNLREMVKENGSLACCSPWGCKESNTTDWLHNSNNFCLIFWLSKLIFSEVRFHYILYYEWKWMIKLLKKQV